MRNKKEKGGLQTSTGDDVGREKPGLGRISWKKALREAVGWMDERTRRSKEALCEASRGHRQALLDSEEKQSKKATYKK
jgi:hypothetical protein